MKDCTTCVTEESLRRLLNSRGMKRTLSRTLFQHPEKPFDDARPYSQERVDVVTRTGLDALKGSSRS